MQPSPLEPTRLLASVRQSVVLKLPLVQRAPNEGPQHFYPREYNHLHGTLDFDDTTIPGRKGRTQRIAYTKPIWFHHTVVRGADLFRSQCRIWCQVVALGRSCPGYILRSRLLLGHLLGLPG